MKIYLLAWALLVVILPSSATTYYSSNNSAPNSTSSWHSTRYGGGSSPSNFTGADIFIIQANHTMTTTANWNLTGTNAKLIIEGNATLRANDKVQVDKFEIYAGGTYIHNDNSSTFPGDNERILAATSTVEITDWNGSSKFPESTTWGNLIVDLEGYDNNINQAGSLTSIAGNFILRALGSGKEFRLAAGQDFTLTIGGNLQIEGGILEVSSSNSSANQTIIINGSYIQSGGTFARSNNKTPMLEVQFNGASSTYTKTGGTIENTYMNWVINSGKKLTLNDDISVSLLRSFTANGTLDCEDGRVTGLGAFILNSTGKLITNSTQGISGVLALTGLLTLNTGGSYEFESATTTPFPLSLSAISATNITIGANVTFNKSVTITGTLALNAGKATIPTGTTVTISSGNAISGSGFSSTKHIVTQVNSLTGAMGTLRIQNFTGTRTLPVGNGTYYLPVTLNATGTNDFSVCVYNGLTANGLPNGSAQTAAYKKRAVDAVWMVNRNSGSSAVSMSLGWPSSLEGSTFAGASDNEIGITHFGSYWEAAFGTGNQAANSATRTGILSFSPFSIYTGSIPLPLHFGGIKANQVDSGVHLDWFSLTETDVDHFEIERSNNGTNYSVIGKMNAAGNSTTRKDYYWLDPVTKDGIFFYRIKIVDIDGRINYSSMVRINVTQKVPTGLQLYPNPVLDKKLAVQAGFLAAGLYKVDVFDQAGTAIYHQNFDHNGGSFTQFVQLPPSTRLGIYTVSLTGGQNTRLTKSIVVK